jgi:type VI secretion system protein ImpJ
MFYAPQVHPESIYLQLLALAGALTTFSKHISPQDLPKYDHERQGICFATLETALMELLDTVIPSRLIALPLQLVRTSVYTTEIEDDGDLIANSRLYLAIAAEIPTADLIARTPALVKTCSATQLETLIRQALPGLPITHLPSPPQEIPVKLNYQYFSLDRSGAAWETIKRSRNFGAYVPAEIKNPRLELILIPSSESSKKTA